MILLFRHLKDEDNLSLGRDTVLLDNQNDVVDSIVTKIFENLDNGTIYTIFFYTSYRKRTLETVRLLKDEISIRKKDIKVLIEIDHGLMDMDLGTYVLPDNYRPGDIYEPFNVAWKVFWDETFRKNNPKYHFGDPVLNKDGSFEYAALKGFFSRYGENHSQFCCRFYQSVLKVGSFWGRLNREQELIIITHEAFLVMFREIEMVADKIVTENYEFPVGSLMNICWESYCLRENKKISEFGRDLRISFKHIVNQKFIKKLEEEISFLSDM